MSTIFFTSDLHLGHKNIVTFTDDDGNLMRPWDNVNLMNEFLKDSWNKIVNPSDKVYVLGDIAFTSDALRLLDSMHGRKVLVMGNHDKLKMSEYLKVFKEVLAVKRLDVGILTHIPLHEDSIERYGNNIHGHLHCRRVKKNGVINPVYQNVSVEQTGFAPISLEDLEKKIKKEKELYGG